MCTEVDEPVGKQSGESPKPVQAGGTVWLSTVPKWNALFNSDDDSRPIIQNYDQIEIMKQCKLAQM